MQTSVCRNGDRKKKAVWGLKVGNTYHGGDRMVGGGLTHSPHYHLLHYAESDPLMGHTGGGGQASVTAHHSHTGRGETRGKMEGREAVLVHGSTQEHSTQNTKAMGQIRIRGNMLLKRSLLEHRIYNINNKTKIWS